MDILGHRRHRRRLDAYVDGELDGHRTRSVAAHVADCWGCSDELHWRRLIKASTAAIGDRGAADLTLARLQRWGRGLTP
jgi:anti-sigma factor RsiW